MPSHSVRAWFGLVGSAALCACSGGPQLPSLSTAALPSLPASDGGYVAAGSVETYSRIARGANRCWLGAFGRLKASHILHADADSQQKGGAVEIVLHERAVDQPKPWGFKAYRISISETAGRSLVSVENLRMSELEHGRMRAEVMRWAEGGDACEVALVVPEPASAGAKKAPSGKAAR